MLNITIQNNKNKPETLSTESALIITNGAAGMANCEREYLKQLRLDDKHVISPIYNENIKKLCEKYSRYLTISWPDNICCMVDEEWTPSEKATINTLWKINIKKANTLFNLMTGYEYILEMRGYWLGLWSTAQINAAIMSQLLRINPEDGSIYKYSEDFHSKLIATFGKDYLDTKSTVIIPDLLKHDIDLREFPEASWQIRIDDLDKEAV